MAVQAGDRHRRHQVVRVESAEEACGERAVSPRRRYLQRQARHVPGDTSPHRRRGGIRPVPAAEHERDRLHVRRQRADQVSATRVVGVDHRVRETRRLEQCRLGPRVGIHVRVIVEVVAAQIGEHRGVDPDRFDSALVEGVGRHLHGERVESGIAHLRQPAVDLDRARCRQPRLLEHPGPTRAKGPHHRAPVAAAACREMRHGRLAVRSGHRRDRQIRGRVAVESRRGASDRTGNVGNPDDDRSGIEPRRRAVALHDDGRGARGSRAAGEPARIDTPPPACKEQRAGHHGAAVVAHRRHRPIQIGGNRRVSVEERRQARECRCPGGRHGHCFLSGVEAAAATLIAGLRITSGSSGAMPSTRSEPSTMSENTGAATAPP